MTWKRYEGRALVDTNLAGDALEAALEDHVRVQNPQFTDVRLESVLATEDYDTRLTPPGRWYRVSYLAEGEDL